MDDHPDGLLGEGLAAADHGRAPGRRAQALGQAPLLVGSVLAGPLDDRVVLRGGAVGDVQAQAAAGGDDRRTAEGPALVAGAIRGHVCVCSAKARMTSHRRRGNRLAPVLSRRDVNCPRRPVGCRGP